MSLKFIRPFIVSKVKPFRPSDIISRLMSQKYTIVGGSVIQLPPFKNELNYNPNTWAEWTSGTVTIANGYLTFSSAGSSGGAALNNTNFKASNKYGVLCHIKSNTRNANSNLFSSAGGYVFPSAIVISPGQAGNFKAVATSNASITSNKWEMYFPGGTGAVEIGSLRVFELPPGSEIESDFTNLSADALAKKYPFNPNQIKGALNVTLKGLTVVNAVKNGNFASGTTGWVHYSNYCTESIVGGWLRSTKDTNRPYVGTDSLYNMPSGRKILLKFNIRANKSGNVAIKYQQASVASGGGSVGASQNLAVTTSSQPISVIFTPTTITNNIVFDGMDFTASGDYIEIQNVITVDLNAHSIEAYTQAQCDAIFQTYFEGVGSVPPMRLRSVGKNLFDKSKYDSKTELGNDTTSTVGYITTPIKVKPSTAYYMKTYDGSYTTIGKGTYILIADSKINNNNTLWVASNTGVGSHEGTITSDANGYLYIKTSSSISDSLLSEIFTNINVQLELGSTATAFTPYTESIVTSPAESKSVGTVADTWDSVTGTRTKRNEEKVLQASDVIAMVTTSTNLDSAFVLKPTDAKGYSNTGVSNSFLEGYTEATSGFVGDSATYIGQFSSGNNNTYYMVGFAKGTTLAQAQTALAGKKLIYQLATPQIKDYSTLQNMLYPKGLTAEKGGTVYLEAVDGSALSIVPTAEIQYEVSS